MFALIVLAREWSQQRFWCAESIAEPGDVHAAFLGRSSRAQSDVGQCLISHVELVKK